MRYLVCAAYLLMARIFALSDTHLAPWPAVPAVVDLILFAGDSYNGPSIFGMGDQAADAQTNGSLFPDEGGSCQGCPPVPAVRAARDGLDLLGFFGAGRDITGMAIRALSDPTVGGVRLVHHDHT